jgi:protein-S-isoprenylcysteine O-methyltransferase Ste14
MERWLWLFLIPVVVSWVALPALAVRGRLAWLGLPAWAGQVPLVLGLRWAAAFLAVGCYLLSLGCWWRLGRNWSLAVVPKQKSQLVTEGVYCWVRHPIYSLSILLMLASALILPTGPMLLVACVHLLVMNLKARHEEHHLVRRFGQPYVVYCRQVGRFWPRGAAELPLPRTAILEVQTMRRELPGPAAVKEQPPGDRQFGGPNSAF